MIYYTTSIEFPKRDILQNHEYSNQYSSIVEALYIQYTDTIYWVLACLATSARYAEPLEPIIWDLGAGLKSIIVTDTNIVQGSYAYAYSVASNI